MSCCVIFLLVCDVFFCYVHMFACLLLLFLCLLYVLFACFVFLCVVPPMPSCLFALQFLMLDLLECLLLFLLCRVCCVSIACGSLFAIGLV